MNHNTKIAFAAAIGKHRPIILDGGLATQLEAQGCNISNALWSASLLTTDAQAIVNASRAYLDAGAECIATASYQEVALDLLPWGSLPTRPMRSCCFR